MKIISRPDPPKQWSITETCKDCTSVLEVNEIDLFRMGPEFAAFSPRYNGVLAAGFQCPVCMNCQVIQVEYPQPEILLEYHNWQTKVHPEKTYPNVVYNSPYNKFHSIHLSGDGVRLIYPDATRTMYGPYMQVMSIGWPIEQRDEKYHETKALLDQHANRIFEDPKFPLNGLRYAYDGPDWGLVRDTLEERLRQTLTLAMNERQA